MNSPPLYDEIPYRVSLDGPQAMQSAGMAAEVPVYEGLAPSALIGTGSVPGYDNAAGNIPMPDLNDMQIDGIQMTGIQGTIFNPAYNVGAPPTALGAAMYNVGAPPTALGAAMYGELQTFNEGLQSGQTTITTHVHDVVDQQTYGAHPEDITVPNLVPAARLSGISLPNMDDLGTIAAEGKGTAAAHTSLQRPNTPSPPAFVPHTPPMDAVVDNDDELTRSSAQSEQSHGDGEYMKVRTASFDALGRKASTMSQEEQQAFATQLDTLDRRIDPNQRAFASFHQSNPLALLDNAGAMQRTPAPNPELLNIRDGLGNTPIAWAVRGKTVEAVAFFMEHSADLNIANLEGSTPLHSSCGFMDTTIVQQLLRGRVHVDCRDHDGNTPLMWAARSGDAASAHSLLVAKADINAVNSNGATALIHAAIQGHDAVIACILGQPGVQPENSDRDGRTALHWSCAVGSVTCAKAIMAAAPVCAFAEAENGNTPLHTAIEYDYSTVVDAVVAQLSERQRLKLYVMVNGDGMNLMDMADATMAKKSKAVLNFLAPDDLAASPSQSFFNPSSPYTVSGVYAIMIQAKSRPLQ